MNLFWYVILLYLNDLLFSQWIAILSTATRAIATARKHKRCNRILCSLICILLFTHKIYKYTKVQTSMTYCTRVNRDKMSIVSMYYFIYFFVWPHTSIRFPTLSYTEHHVMYPIYNDITNVCYPLMGW